MPTAHTPSDSLSSLCDLHKISYSIWNCERMENLETLFREIYDNETCYAEKYKSKCETIKSVLNSFSFFTFNCYGFSISINKTPIIAQSVNFSSFPNIARHNLIIA